MRKWYDYLFIEACKELVMNEVTECEIQFENYLLPIKSFPPLFL